MWTTTPDTPHQHPHEHLSHDLPCPACGHAVHTFLACSDSCDCAPTVLPGSVAVAA